jgi:2-amino-4-hydroxy-6-hydroxymethyldihydropteridine diphosphokinase
MKNRGFEIDKASSVYETEPVGYKDQDSFYNMAVSGYFHGEPEELLGVIRDVENCLGRVRVLKYGPRTIDIDIIIFGDSATDSEELVIPHPEFRNRRFVLIPACEIEPDVIDPVTGKSIKQILSECTDNSKVKKERSEVQS